jgi:hypothetical protein
MEQIIIKKADGTTVPMVNRRTVTGISSAKQNRELLGKDTVNITVESPFAQKYDIGDSITAFGRIYRLNRLPKVSKTGNHSFQYELEFEGVQYDLMRATYDLTIDTTNNELQDVQGDSLTGDLSRFAKVLVSNANRIFGEGAWELGDCPDTEEDKTLTFGSESDNCLSALQKLCQEFKVEFEIIQESGIFTIHFKEKVGQIFPHTFEFGKGKGLYELTRQNVDSSNIVTRLKVYGSTENITSKYRWNPDAGQYGATRLCLPDKSKGQSFIENEDAIARYGIFEATKYFDDIKPTFNGVVTGIDAGNVLKFSDSKMFDLNAKDDNGTLYLLNGVTAKIHFNTGNLAGYEFEVSAFDFSTRTFTLKKLTDERDDEFPSSKSPAFRIKRDDKYKILDIALPPNYEQAAETELLEKATEYYDQNSQPKVQYGLNISKDVLKKYDGQGSTVNIFSPGDFIPVKDDDIGVDKSVRIKSLTRDLLDEYDYALTISDTVSTNITARVISEIIDIDKVIEINNLRDPARARANWRSSQEVFNSVFDVEGNYYSDKISPLSVETLALMAGTKSMQLDLNGTVLKPNYNGDRNTVGVTGGVLTHYTINADAARSWNLADNTTTLDSDNKPYYIYAKCARTGDSGAVIFSTEQIKAEQDASYYHFLIGVISSVDMELHTRSIALSYGFTMISGKFIKTGRIESSDGSCYLDLDGNQFYLGNSNSSFDWNVSEANILSILNVAIKLGVTGRNAGVQLNPDGSGHLANGNISWDASGSTLSLLNALVNIANGKILLNPDGSGQLAGGNISWDASGNPVFNGKVEILAAGRKFVIDNENAQLVINNNESDEILKISYDNDIAGNHEYAMIELTTKIYNDGTVSKMMIAPFRINATLRDSSGTIVGGYHLDSDGYIGFTLPTSPDNLGSGILWRNGNSVMITP